MSITSLWQNDLQLNMLTMRRSLTHSWEIGTPFLMPGWATENVSKWVEKPLLFPLYATKRKGHGCFPMWKVSEGYRGKSHRKSTLSKTEKGGNGHGSIPHR